MRKIIASLILISSTSINACNENANDTKSYQMGSSFKEIIESGQTEMCGTGKYWSVEWNAKHDVKLPRTVTATGSYDEDMLLIYKSLTDHFHYVSTFKAAVEQLHRQELVIKITRGSNGCILSVEDIAPT